MDDFKIIYYYQSFNGLTELIERPLIKNINIYVCSLHFNTDETGKINIHLNDYPPEHFTQVWYELKQVNDKGNRILCMLGGAGGAYTTLFQNYELCYPMLKSFLNKYSVIKGIDLDIEEYVDLKDVQKLIRDLNIDFGPDYIITMAPVQDALSTDSPGLGGFSYKDLVETDEGKRIDWFNCQCYYDYSLENYQSVINNGYSSNKVVYGMIGDQTSGDLFKNNIIPTITQSIQKYPKMSGIFLWEYFMKPKYFAENIVSVFKKDKPIEK